jgi:hypothetical protein
MCSASISARTFDEDCPLLIERRDAGTGIKITSSAEHTLGVASQHRLPRGAGGDRLAWHTALRHDGVRVGIPLFEGGSQGSGTC